MPKDSTRPVMGQRIRTAYSSIASERDWDPEESAKRRWGASGRIANLIQRHGAEHYQVLHKDGTFGLYDALELKPWQPGIYIAGPEVFRPDAVEHAKLQRDLCRKYGFEPLHPMDNNLDLGNCNFDTAMRIYLGDIAQVRECDIVVANCRFFRSACVIDDGTAFELGYGAQLGRKLYGYIPSLEPLDKRTIREHPVTFDPESGHYVDSEGYAVTDAYGTSINLMMECAIAASGGRLVEGSFEVCLAAVRADLEAGKISV